MCSHPLQRLRNAITGVAPGPPAPAERADDIVPYRGLATFEEHAEFFFGRERDLQRLLEILKASPLLCVVGPSGSGKSSLVRAGLVPRLRDGGLADGEFKVCVLRPGAHRLQALATQLAQLDPGSSMQATLDDLATDRRTLHLAGQQFEQGRVGALRRRGRLPPELPVSAGAPPSAGRRGRARIARAVRDDVAAGRA